MEDKDFASNRRAMNDYDADKVTMVNGKWIKKEKFVEPKKVAIAPWSNAANETINVKK